MVIETMTSTLPLPASCLPPLPIPPEDDADEKKTGDQHENHIVSKYVLDESVCGVGAEWWKNIDNDTSTHEKDWMDYLEDMDFSGEEEHVSFPTQQHHATMSSSQKAEGPSSNNSNNSSSCSASSFPKQTMTDGLLKTYVYDALQGTGAGVAPNVLKPSPSSMSLPSCSSSFTSQMIRIVDSIVSRIFLAFAAKMTGRRMGALCAAA